MKKLLTTMLLIFVLAATGCGGDRAREIKFDNKELTENTVAAMINAEIAENAEKNDLDKDALTFMKVSDIPGDLIGAWRSRAGVEIYVRRFGSNPPGEFAVAFDNARPEQVKNAVFVTRTILGLVDRKNADELLTKAQLEDTGAKPVAETVGEIKVEKASLNNAKRRSGSEELGVPLTVVIISAKDARDEGYSSIKSRAESMARTLIEVRWDSADPNTLLFNNKYQ